MLVFATDDVIKGEKIWVSLGAAITFTAESIQHSKFQQRPFASSEARAAHIVAIFAVAKMEFFQRLRCFTLDAHFGFWFHQMTFESPNWVMVFITCSCSVIVVACDTTSPAALGALSKGLTQTALSFRDSYTTYAPKGGDMAKTCRSCGVKLRRFYGKVEVSFSAPLEDAAPIIVTVTGYVCPKCGTGFLRTVEDEDDMVIRVFLVSD